MLQALWPDLHIVAEAEDGIEALHALEQHRPQVLFLDIEMPGMSGIEVAKAASGRCHIVFVTAYDQYAVSAFEQGAVDYVMKPISVARMAAAVSRLKERLNSAPAQLDGMLRALAATAPKRPHLRWINASQGQTLKVITVNEICYFKSDNKYTLVVTPHQESVIRRPIKELVQELDPTVFWQIHRGTVINANAIAGVQRDVGGHLRVKLKERKETLLVSDPYVHLFKSM
jgi:DNA-binding LytR/AlgR family response regulator